MKIFCIGMQKTGTISLHNFFQNNNFKSTHDAKWWYNKNLEYFDKFDCYSDGFERYEKNVTFPDLTFLENNFKNCKFILQTRSLRKWLISRLRHGSRCYLKHHNTKIFDEKVFLTWVSDRNYWHNFVYKYFEDKDNLLVLDIESDNIEKKLCIFLNIRSNVTIGNDNKKQKGNKKSEIFITETIDKFLNDYIVKEDHNTKSTAKLKDHY